jgi:hypothetical protein
MNRAVLAGVRNCPNCDFLFASVLLDTFNLVASIVDNKICPFYQHSKIQP